MGRPNPIFLEQQDVYLSLTNESTTTTSSPVVDIDYFVIPNSGAPCASVISQNTFQNTTQLVPAGWRKIADILVSADNCGPYKFIVSGTFSQYFAVYNSSLYIDSVVFSLASRVYTVTVSIVDIANRFAPVSRNFTVSITACPSTTTVAPITTTTTTAMPTIGGNSANYNNQAVWGGIANVTTVGSNGGPSAYGTYDQAGNVYEWNDLDGTPSSSRGLRGGPWYLNAFYLSSSIRNTPDPSNVYSDIGFRLASSLNPLNLSYFVNIGNPGNSNDSTGYGGVSTNYLIGKYSVTNCEYVLFLNSVDPEGINPQGIYNASMGSSVRGGITFVSGNANGSKYATKTNMSNKPVVYVNWFDCARYCNWLHNGGLPYNTTSSAANARNTGAYNVGTAITGNAVAKEVGANYYIPTENEWYKAAYYKGGGTNAGYWLYATQSDTAPTPVTASSTGNGLINGQPARVTDYSCPTITTTTVAPVTTSTTTTVTPATTTGPSPLYIGYSQMPYGNGTVGSFGNVVGTEDLFDPNFSTVFIQACNLITFFTSNPSILVFQSGDTTHMSRLLSVLSNFSSNVSSTSQSWSTFTNQNNLINNRALVIIPFNYNWNTGDMPLSGQNAIINYVQNGGSLLTTEWFHWLLAIGKMASLIQLSPCVPTSTYSTVTNMTFSKFNLSNQSIQFASSPSSFSWSPSRLSPLQGSHTHLNSLRNGATQYWSMR